MTLATKSSRSEGKKLVGREFESKLTATIVILIILAGCVGISISVIISTMYDSAILSPFSSSSSSEEETSIPLVRDIGGTPLTYPDKTIQTSNNYAI